VSSKMGSGARDSMTLSTRIEEFGIVQNLELI
jgi:hypothetical protein